MDEPNQQNGSAEEPVDDGNVARILIWIGVAALSSAVAFTLVRAFTPRRPTDPTSRRIQQLIDEANELLKTLDDQRTT